MRDCSPLTYNRADVLFPNIPWPENSRRIECIHRRLRPLSAAAGALPADRERAAPRLRRLGILGQTGSCIRRSAGPRAHPRASRRERTDPIAPDGRSPATARASFFIPCCTRRDLHRSRGRCRATTGWSSRTCGSRPWDAALLRPTSPRPRSCATARRGWMKSCACCESTRGGLSRTHRIRRAAVLGSAKRGAPVARGVHIWARRRIHFAEWVSGHHELSSFLAEHQHRQADAAHVSEGVQTRARTGWIGYGNRREEAR